MRIQLNFLQSAFLAAVCLAAAPALGQETISQHRDDTTALFTERDLVALDRAVALTPEQSVAARKIAEAATNRAALLSGTWHRDIDAAWKTLAPGKDPEAENRRQREFRTRLDRERSDLMDRLQAIERHAVAELRALLEPAQAQGTGIQTADADDDRGSGGWVAFERARRLRVTEDGDWWRGLPTSPRAALSWLKPDGPDLKTATRIVRIYERELDPLVVARLQAQERWRQQQRAGTEAQHPHDPADLKDGEIRALRVRTLGQLERELSPEAARRLLALRVSSELMDYHLTRPSQNEMINRLAGLSGLSPAQQSAIKDLSAAADATALGELAKLLHELDALSPGETLTEEVRQPKLFKTQMSNDLASIVLLQDLEQLLTAPQREEFDLACLSHEQDSTVMGEMRSPWLPASAQPSPPTPPTGPGKDHQ